MADACLAGVVAEDHRLAQELVRGDAAIERAFGGDPQRIRVHLQLVDAQGRQVRPPLRTRR